jgi:ElaA protein
LNQQIDVSGVAWRCRPFGELSATELYALLQLRAEVFVVEQTCAFQDLDGRDDQALHLLGEAPDDAGRTRLLAYARLLPAGTAFPEASIGRVVTAGTTRGSGLGHALMQEAIQTLHQTWGPQAIRIGAQAHLQAFYGRHGFEPDGAVYLEDGIDHIEMVTR